MQAMPSKIVLPVLLLCAAGCARPVDASGPAGTQAPVPVGHATAAQPQPQPQPGAQQAQGIRVGEPSPYDRNGPKNPAPGEGWHAFGNEPFWSVQARGGTLVFTTPEDQRGVTLLGRRVPSLVGTVILGSGPKGEFHFGVTPGQCSDGMSDRTHAFNSTFIYGGVTYKGCAEAVEAR